MISMTCGRGDAGPTCQRRCNSLFHRAVRRSTAAPELSCASVPSLTEKSQQAAARFCLGGRRSCYLARRRRGRRFPRFLPVPIRIFASRPPPRESRVAAMKVELAARTSQTGKTEDTPPPSPAAVDAPSAAEDAPLLPDGGVRRRAGCGRFARSGSFRREVSRAAAETFLLTRLTLILLRYLGYMSIPFRFSFWLLVAILVCCAACFTYAMY